MKSLKIQSTTDYDIFKITHNRPVLESRVESLGQSIEEKNLLREFPIVVNSKYEVKDGQHRLGAAKKLGVPIYFIVSDNIDVIDIAKVNKNVKHWNIADYMAYHASLGNESCKWVLGKSIEWNLTPEVVCRILGTNGNAYKKAIVEGKFELSVQHMHRAIALYKMLLDFKEVFPRGWKQRNFIIAVRCMRRTKQYDHNIMLKRFDLLSRSFRKQPDTISYIEMLEEIYNHHLRGAKIRFERPTNNTKQWI